MTAGPVSYRLPLTATEMKAFSFLENLFESKSCKTTQQLGKEFSSEEPTL